MKYLKILGRIIGVSLVVLLVALCGLYFWATTAKTEIKTDLREHAETVEVIYLERFGGDNLERKVISKDDFLPWLESLPASSGRATISITMCWRPHHRVLFQQSDGDEELTICFDCDEMRSLGSKRSHIPKGWVKPFRHLFTSHGIPDIHPDAERYVEETSIQLPATK